MNNLLDLFAAALRSARIKRGLTQRALAERLNMSVRTIIEIERCRSSPKFETVMLLARELNVSLDAIVFQNMSTSNVSKSVIDFFAGKSEPEIQKYLHFCGEITGMKRTENEERCKELLELVGLGNETHHIKGFSRGMKQRLGIAQALLNRPKLLICDEPTSALDPVGRKEILDILLAIREQTTVLVSSSLSMDVRRQ